MSAKTRRPLSPQDRARVERRLLAESDSRTLVVAGTCEPRISRAEENKIADRARHDQRETDDGEASMILANMQRELDRLRSLLPGDQRGYFREIDHGLRKLTNAVK